MPKETQQEIASVPENVRCGKFMPHKELLTYEELLRVVRIAVGMGMTKVRLTGGEPLVRRGVLDFIQELSGIEGLEQIRLTTNGVLLADYSERLYSAGIRYLNVSLDTLVPSKFQEITGFDYFDKVWNGLQVAKEQGFKIKLNVVAMKGFNDDEFKDFGQLAIDHSFQVRFIEYMPVGEKSSWGKEKFVKSEEIKACIEQLGELTPFRRKHGMGPASMYDLVTPDNKRGVVGFISPISHHFCDQCNRLRLTSEGKLRACLLKDEEVDLKPILRGNGTDKQLMSKMRQTILDKPQGHTLEQDLAIEERASCRGRMSRIGG